MPGKKNSTADFLSCYPSRKAAPDSLDSELDEDLAASVTSVTMATIQDGCTMDEETVRRATGNDSMYQMLIVRVISRD